MIFVVKSVNVALLLVVVVVVVGVCSYPQPSVGYGDAASGSKYTNIGKHGIKERAQLSNNENLAKYKNSSKKTAQNGVTTKTDKINEEETKSDKQKQKNGNSTNRKEDLHNDDKIRQHSLRAQSDEGVVAGSVEVNDENIEGYVDFPNQQVAEDKPGEDVVIGTLEINDENIEGRVEIPNTSDNQLPEGGASDEDAVAGSIEINDKNIEGHVDLPNMSNNQQVEIGGDTQFGGDTVTGSVEINDENIEGYVELPSNDNNQKNTNNESDGDVLAGSVEINDKNIEGHIDLPSNDNNPKHTNNDSDGGVVAGSVEINDEYIEGNVHIPDEGIIQQDSDSEKDGNSQSNKNTITGSIEVNDQNIKGHLELPDEDQQYNGQAITGNIEIDGEYIQGHINIPSDLEKEITNQGLHEENNQGEGDEIAGLIEEDDENIQGQIHIPSDVENAIMPQDFEGNAKQEVGGEINGSIKIDGEHNIQGYVNILSDSEKEITPQDADDEITGSIEMNDEYVEGHVDVPEENYDTVNEDVINGSIDIDDENIKGNVDFPGEDYGEIPKASDDGFPSNGDNKNIVVNYDNQQNNVKHKVQNYTTGKSCWMDLKSKPYLDALDELDAKYQKTRQKYQDEVGAEFDKKMMEVLITSQGVAPRAIRQAHGNPSSIPAGINLGGVCMMRMAGSLLFFHRMKLRNSTRFRVDHLSTQLTDMTLAVRMSLYDLHLRGAYERSVTGSDHTELYYVPSFGELDVLLKDVKYEMEGRLRMLNQRLIVELVSSNLATEEILLTYDNDTTSMKIKPQNLEDYLERLKTDLDSWMKDYFNDYLMYFGIVGGKDTEIQQYEKQKTIKVNEYGDHIINGIKKKLKSMGTSLQLPSFKIKSVLGTQIKLKTGHIHGLDSIYRRSVAMTKSKKRVRQLDMMVSFSKLKVEYQYEVMVHPTSPALTGMLILSADELTAHLEVSHMVDSEIFDMSFNSITQMKPEALTLEGPANRIIAEFKHILENPIIAIMTNVLKHNIKMLKTLTRCVPYIKGNNKKRDENADTDHSN